MLQGLKELKEKIRSIPDFPKPGILFRDITTLIKEGEDLRRVIDALCAPFADKRIEAVVGIESRGFILGAPIADRLGAGFIPVRKPGKLPAETAKVGYQLEYGEEQLEIHRDAVIPGMRVLLVDDLLATGGTAAAAAQLVTQFGGEVIALVFMIELVSLQGREKLPGYKVFSLFTYDGD